MVLNLDHEGKAIHGPTGRWQLTFSELKSEILLAIPKLKTIAQTNTVFSLKMSQERQNIIHLIAALQMGAPTALMSVDWTETELQKRKEILGPSVSLDPETLGQVSMSARQKVCPDTRLIVFTSGSTGTPKAVQLSTQNISSNISAVQESLSFAKIKSQHLFLNLSYSFGCLGQLLPALDAGIETFLHRSFLDIKQLLEQGELSGMVSGVPSQLRQLSLFSLKPNLKVTDVVSAGAFLPMELRNKLLTTFPNARISSNYGQTEASPRILSVNSMDKKFFSSIVGKFVPGITGRLTEAGELMVKGPQIMLGYLGDKKATNEKIHDGWLQTGDLAKIDEDGVVSILGRLDEQMKVSGERVSPIEIETVIAEVLELSECLIFQQENQDGETYLALALVGDLGRYSPSEIRKKISAVVSKQKIPKVIYFAKSLPRTSNGKLIRKGIQNEIKDWIKI